MATFNEKSIFTADDVAYKRIFTDIQLSREIWDILTEIQGQPPAGELERMKRGAMLPFFEARYLLTNRELEKSGIRQILELASGLSSRGMIMTKSPDVTYVEIDLPEKIAVKRKVVAELVKRQKIEFHPNLHLEEGNVLNTDDFKRASGHFNDNEPVAVICEGLLRYISFPDKEILGRSILELLKRSGGMWITPDFQFLRDMRRVPSLPRGKVETITGISVEPNLFRDEAHAESFLKGLGFDTVTKYPMSEVAGQLVCPKRLGIPDEAVTFILNGRWTFVMRCGRAV